MKSLNIKNPHKLLSYSLLLGAIYFFLISFAHLFGIKIPILYIYFNVPSYIYQDLIIAFLSFGFGMFLYAGYASVKRKELFIVKYILISGLGAIIGIMSINIISDFKYFETEFNIKISLITFWSETILVVLYVAWLVLLYLKAIKSNKEIIDEHRTNYGLEQSLNQQKFNKFR